MKNFIFVFVVFAFVLLFCQAQQVLNENLEQENPQSPSPETPQTEQAESSESENPLSPEASLPQTEPAVKEDMNDGEDEFATQVGEASDLITATNATTIPVTTAPAITLEGENSKSELDREEPTTPVSTIENVMTSPPATEPITLPQVSTPRPALTDEITTPFQSIISPDEISSVVTTRSPDDVSNDEQDKTTAILPTTTDSVVDDSSPRSVEDTTSPDLPSTTVLNDMEGEGEEKDNTEEDEEETKDKGIIHSHGAQASVAVVSFLVLLGLTIMVARKRGYLCSDYEDVYDRSTSYQHNNTPDMNAVGGGGQAYNPL